MESLSYQFLKRNSLHQTMLMQFHESSSILKFYKNHK
jgi:hypothetical protein